MPPQLTDPKRPSRFLVISSIVLLIFIIECVVLAAPSLRSFLFAPAVSTSEVPVKIVESNNPAPAALASVPTSTEAFDVSPESVKTAPADIKADTDAKIAVPAVASKSSGEFEKIFEISSDEQASPRGLIDGSTAGRTFWVVDGKLAFVVSYLGQRNAKGERITELRYDNKILPVGSMKPPEGYNDYRSGVVIDGKTVSVKTEVKNISADNFEITYVLFVGGKEYAKGIGDVVEVVEYKDQFAYIVANASITGTRKEVVMYQGQAVSKEYYDIRDLKVVGGSLAYLAQKNPPAPDTDWLNTEPRDPQYVLMWNGREYGAEYDSVEGYVNSAGVPAFIAANQDKESSLRTSPRFLVRDDTLLFSGKQDEEMISDERELVDVNGNPAIIVRAPMTRSLYVYYKGKKFFEGYDIFYVRNVNNKLAILAQKNKTQYVFLEK